MRSRATGFSSPEDRLAAQFAPWAVEEIAAVMKTMTERRVRHLPVIEDGALKGMVSIGDVVKHRLEETELEARVLRDYVLAAH